MVSVIFGSCEKEKEVSIVGNYDLSRSEYYFDGQLLDYQASVIGICDSLAFKPVLMYRYDVAWSFNSDGSGAYIIDTIHVPFTYTLNGKEITLDFGEEEESDQYETSLASIFTFEDGKIRVSDTYSGIHGWAKVDNREEVFGLDGQKNHKLEAVHYYSKILKE